MAQGKRINDMANGNSKYQQSSMSFPRKESSLNGNKTEGRQGGNPNTFRIDSSISGGRFQGERTLQRWVPDVPVEYTGTLETSSSKPGESWDQFAENKRLFGLTSDYDENIYTTTIDRSHPQYKQRAAEADRKAREIERSTAKNSHVAEERILDNIGETDNKLGEEDKYSSVQREQTLTPLPAPTSNKYLPPARRTVTTQSLSTCAAVCPTTISSQLSRTEKAIGEAENSTSNSTGISKLTKSDTQPISSSSNITSTPDPKPSITSTSASSRNVSPNIKSEVLPNATATVERDVASAFKNFASQQRKNIDQIRISRAKNDKEVKLKDLKAFADSFKLHTPVPSDLVPIIAKDPKKQKEIQAKAQRNALEAEASKIGTPEPTKTTSSVSEARISRPSPSPHGSSSSSSNALSRQNNVRNVNFPQQNTIRGSAQQNSSLQQNRTVLGNRLRSSEQAKPNSLPQNQSSTIDPRLPSICPSNNTDVSSSRSCGVTSVHGVRLNPNSIEFRPSPHAATFNPSTGSSPRSVVTGTVHTPIIRIVLRRKPVSADERPTITAHFDTLDFIKSLTPPAGKELTWKATGGLRPAYDTQPVWKQLTAEDKADSPIKLTYNQVFESALYTSHLISPNQNHILPQLSQQQQQSIHLSHASHNVAMRHSPHQVPIAVYGNPQVPNPTYNGSHDDHRMIASHSAQSFASPRLQSAPMAYPSPINQAAQLAYNPQIVQYTNTPQIQAGFRPLSNNHQFMPQQTPINQMMLPNHTNTFVSSQSITPNPQMMFPTNQPPPFMQVTNGHPPLISNMNGFPSPGRAPPIMINQGSQQGPQQPIYGINPGISPGPNYGNPIFSQQPPVQIPIRPFTGPNSQPHGTSPQPLHLYATQNRRSNQNSGTFHPVKSFQHSQPHNNTTNNQIPVISQLRGIEGSDEAK